MFIIDIEKRSSTGFIYNYMIFCMKMNISCNVSLHNSGVIKIEIEISAP